MQQPARVGVAFSGGPDSTALLSATAKQAALLGLHVVALHVHHGLLPEADAWLQHAREVCARLAVGFASARLSGGPAPGESVEAWARAGRYRALAELAHAQEVSLVLLAQHADDQAETVLLQALRGAGAEGLAGMRAHWTAEGLCWARPWLDRPRAQLTAYLAHSALPCVTDPSNTDPRYARSRLRQQVLPALTAVFPQAVQGLRAVALQARHARGLGEEVAAQDLPGCMQGDALLHGAWSQLPPARRRNALRAWLQGAGCRHPSRSLLDRLMAQWRGQGGRWSDAQCAVCSSRGALRLVSSLIAKD